MEVVFGLLAVTKSRYANTKATISGLCNCFSCLPVPDYTQSDNGSLLTSVMAQHWDRKEDIKGIFHIIMELFTLLSPNKQDGDMYWWFVKKLLYTSFIWMGWKVTLCIV